MDNTPSDWKISTLRWTAWLILCLGMAFEIFIVSNAGTTAAIRVLAEQAIRQQNAGQSADTAQMESDIYSASLCWVFILGIIAVALSVALDYYLRAGEKNGHLFRRIGLAAGIELSVYALAMLIQIYI
jgi:hypothetical protein